MSHHITSCHTRQSSTNSTAISYHTLHIPRSTHCHTMSHTAKFYKQHCKLLPYSPHSQEYTLSHHVTHSKVLQTALQSLTILSTFPGVHIVTSCHTRQSSTNSTAISYHTLHIPRSTHCHTMSHTAKFYKQHCNLLPYSPHSQEYTMSHHVTHGKVLQTALQSLTILSTFPGVHIVTPRHTRQSSTNSTASSYHTLHIPRSTPCHIMSHTAKFYKQNCKLLPYSPHSQEYTMSHHVTHGKVLQTALQSLTILSTFPGVHHVTSCHTRQSSTNSTAISYHTLHIPRSTHCHTMSHTAKFYKQHCNLLPYSPHSQEYTMSHHVTHGKVLQTALQSLTILSTFPGVHIVTPCHTRQSSTNSTAISYHTLHIPRSTHCHIMSHTAKFYKQHCNLLPYSPHSQEYTLSHHVTHGKVLQTALQSLTILSTFPGVHHVTSCHTRQSSTNSTAISYHTLHIPRSTHCHTMSHTAKFYKQHCNLLPYSPHSQEYTLSHHVTHGKVLQTALQSLTILSTFPGVHIVTPCHTRQSSTNSTAISYHTLHIPRSTHCHTTSHTAKFYKQHCNLLPYSPHSQEYTMSHHVTHGKVLQTALQSLTILSTFPGVHHVTSCHTRQSSTNSTAISYHTLHIPRSTHCHTMSHTAKFYKQHCNLLPYSPHSQEYTLSHHVTHGKVLQTALQSLTILSTFPGVHIVTPCHTRQSSTNSTAISYHTLHIPRSTPCHIMSHTAKFYKQNCKLLPYSPHSQEYTMSHHVTHGKVLQTELQALTILSTFRGVHHVTPRHTRQSSTNSTAISYHTLHIPRSTHCHTMSHTAKFYKQHCNLLPYSPHSQEYTLSHHVTHGKVLQTALQSLTILSTFPGVHIVTPCHTRQSSTNSTAISYHTLHIPRSTHCHTMSHTAKFYKQHCNLLPYSPHSQEYTMSHHVTHGKVLQTELQALTILSTFPGVHHVTPRHTRQSSTNSTAISYHTLHIPRSTPCHTTSHTAKFYKQHCNLLPYSPHSQEYTLSHHVTHGKVLQTALQSLTILSTFPGVHHVTPCHTRQSSTNSTAISYHTLHISRSAPCHIMSHYSHHVTHGKVLQTAL